MSIKNKSVLLPNYISPISYKLKIKPDFESFTFSGNEIIKIKISKETNKITLHSRDIDIETVKYINNKKEQYSSKITYDIKKETATFYFKNKISKGQGEISIIFSGIISENLRGFYKSKYKIDGKEKHLVTTQFEATDARRAFPCFDEPAQKATFEVSFIIPNNHIAISNTLPKTCKTCSADHFNKNDLGPIELKEHESGYKIVSFAPTPKMSTYLLAFIIGEFEYVEGKTKEEVQIRVFTTKGKIHQAKFALDIAIKSLEFYNEYFDIPYPMPNLDLIAIPDFEPAGMENWGAITFRESSVLIDEEHSSLLNKQWVTTTIAHELAHQWFGNLVTMHWWTDLWLNEGFASYMEKVCSDKIFPHWKVWNLYLANNRYRSAIEIDSLENSHAIEVEVNHPDEINETFDMVSYEKGTAIVRMISEYIGEDKFREGLRYYLKKHSYKNTKTINLWEAFEKVSGKPVKKIMNTWTKQAGFPLVTLIDSGKFGLKIKQEKFFSSRVMRSKNKNNKLWQIPLLYKTSDSDKKILLNKKSVNLSEKSILKINTDETSFLKVQYNKNTFDNIKKDIEENHINTRDRLGIIRDAFALAEGGYIKTSEALELSMCYKDEKEYIVWTEIAYWINKIYNLIANESFVDKYKKYVLSLFSPLAEKMGFEKKCQEESSRTLLRILAVSQAGFYGDKKIIKEAQKIFSNKIIKPIDPDMRSIIYNIVAQNGTIKEWKIFKELYKKETLNEEKERLSRAMTQFTNTKILEKTIEFVNSKEIKDQDAPFLIATVWNNKHGQDLTWNFMKKNWNNILKKYGGNGLLLSKIMFMLGNHTTLKDLQDAKKFFSKNVAPGAERTLKQAYEKISSNVAWLHDDKKDIENWLNGQDKA